VQWFRERGIKVSERTIRRWIEAGQIRAVKKQGRGGRKGVYFIPEAELERKIADIEDTPITKMTRKWQP
jgi:predicted site-specific integrase-resolvase